MAGDVHSLKVRRGHTGGEGVEALLVWGETASVTFGLRIVPTASTVNVNSALLIILSNNIGYICWCDRYLLPTEPNSGSVTYTCVQFVQQIGKNNTCHKK